MTRKFVTKAVLMATTVSMVVSTLAVSAASAQPYGGPPSYQGYNQPPPDDNYGPPPNGADRGYDNGPPGSYDDQPPPGYNGAAPPPPPPGYDQSAQNYQQQQQQQQDERYASYAERWAQDNCVRSHADVGGGAVVGGLIGALIGSGVAAHGHRTGGALAGAAIGAFGGAAIAAGSDSGETSPGCPPGYVVRSGAPEWGYAGSYYYAAPEWYRPWVMWDGRWTYRPYPYHVWYYSHEWRGRREFHDRDWHGRDHWDRDRDHRDWH
jgi:hypothetical protein